MRSFQSAATLALLLAAASAHALDVFPVLKDPSTDVDAATEDNSAVLGRPYAFADPGAPYGLDINGVVNGNQVMVLTQLPGEVATNGGAGFTFTVLSNGENGIDETRNNGGDAEFDDPNTTPVSSVIEQINGEGQKLQNGNVIRFSMWLRSDPNSPLNFSPQVEPVAKIEMWKEFGSSVQDTNPGLLSPQFGDKIFDQQQHGLPIKELTNFSPDDSVQWVDLDGDGQIGEDDTADDEGRISTLSTEEWTLVETSYEIDDSFWLGIFNNNGTSPPDTSVIDALEEVRTTFFFGDFTALTQTPNTLEGGNLLVDNILVELFTDRAEEQATPNLNPNPILDEVIAPVGDYNGDGVVDAADYTVFRNNEGTEFELPNRDPAATGVVGQDDYDAWAANYGAVSQPVAPPAANAVPEPAGVAALAIAACCGLLTRRRAA